MAERHYDPSSEKIMIEKGQISATEALNSTYIIDGIRKDLTPAMILGELVENTTVPRTCNTMFGEIVDESADPPLMRGSFDGEKADHYLSLIKEKAGRPRTISAGYSGSITKIITAEAILDTLWRDGHFKIGDLHLEPAWKWDCTPIGNMSAFYTSVEELCGFSEMLGVRISDYKFKENCKSSTLTVKAGLSPSILSEDDDFVDTDSPSVISPEPHTGTFICEEPFRSTNPVMRKRRRCPQHISEDQSNWLIYIPFDTCKYHLGGSVLSEVSGIPGGKTIEITDSDYFLDCYEVVREFVEDGIVVSGTTVCTGGLMTALEKMRGESGGIDVDIDGILQAYKEKDIVNVLFGEVPGVVIEIRSSDFDYVDAEMLLQDVAFYPIGHPGSNGLNISRGANGNLAGILLSLLNTQAAEGED